MNTKAHPPGNSVKTKFKLYTGKNNYSLVANARKGVKTNLFYDLAMLIKMSEKTLAQIIHISPRTISNYKENKKSLDPVQSEHLLKLITLYQKGEEIFGNVDEFNYWLQKPFWNEKERPADWLVTPGELILLWMSWIKLAYGDAV